MNGQASLVAKAQKNASQAETKQEQDKLKAKAKAAAAKAVEDLKKVPMLYNLDFAELTNQGVLTNF